MTDDRKGRTVQKRKRKKQKTGGRGKRCSQNTFGAVKSAYCYTETELDRGHRGMNLGDSIACAMSCKPVV